MGKIDLESLDMNSKEDWRIDIQSIMHGVGKILRKEFEDGHVFHRLHGTEADDSDPLVMYWEDADKEKQERYGKLIKREWIEFPYSVYVRLTKECMESMHVLIRCDRFPTLCDLLGAYRKGTTLPSREEKFRNLYQIYEQFSEGQDGELKAIRHSLSHPREKLTSKKTVEILHKLFGDKKMNLYNYKHAKVFHTKIKQLRDESEKLLIKEILKIVPSSPNLLDKYCMP